MINKTYLFLLFSVMCSAVFFAGCEKDKTENDTPQPDANFQQYNTDASNYKSELDQADNDINDMVSRSSLGSGGSGTSSAVCGLTIDTSQIAQKIIIFNFDGITPCFSPSRTRSGTIKVQLTSGNRWGDVGSVLTETFINFKVTRLSDNKSIQLNGVKTYRNINGNDWVGFLMGAKVLKYQERALGIQVRYDNGQTATWNSARVTEWRFVNKNTNPSIPYDHIVFTAGGDTSVNGYSNVDSWGVNRFSDAFTSYYQAPIISNTYCGLWRFNSGVLVHHVNNSDFTLRLGVDQQGNPTPYACAYGFKVTWSSGGNSRSVVLSY